MSLNNVFAFAAVEPVDVDVLQLSPHRETPVVRETHLWAWQL